MHIKQELTLKERILNFFKRKTPMSFNKLNNTHVNPIRNKILEFLDLNKNKDDKIVLYKPTDPGYDLGLDLDVVIHATSELHAYVIFLDYLNDNLKVLNPIDHYDYITYDPVTGQIQPVIYCGDPQWRKSYYWPEDNDTVWIKPVKHLI